MLAKCFSGAITGVDASVVEIEVSSYSAQEPSFKIVGLPDVAVREARDRVMNAIRTSGFNMKFNQAVTVNLAPADVRKEGPLYDLPIAICLVKAMGLLASEALADYGFAGELSLSGAIRRIRGVIPIVIAMKRIGKKAVLVPCENAQEASIVGGIDIIPVGSLREATEFLAGKIAIAPIYTDPETLALRANTYDDDFADVKGQETVRRAVEVAVAGGHNILMIGSPGSGKTMIARRIPSILPPMSAGEILETSKIHSVATAAKCSGVFVTSRPFRAPHHTVSTIGLLGGGPHPIPGEVSLAHRGVLFLDEFAEFPRQALEVLRQPLEDGHVTVSRAAAACDFPSRFMLVAAMNPCPCGYYNDPTRQCHCSTMQIYRYQHRISGPLLDRIDIQIGVNPVQPRELEALSNGESSETMRKRIIRAREIQRERYKDLGGGSTNAEAKSRDLADVCRLSASGREEVRRTIEALKLSARAYDRILRVSRTIADLQERKDVVQADVFEAATYRKLDGTEGSFWL